jgi:hypothetical protein
VEEDDVKHRYENGIERDGRLQRIADETVRLHSALAQVAMITGGWAAFLENPSQASETYSRILSDIDRRYVIGYQPTNKKHDGKLR